MGLPGRTAEKRPGGGLGGQCRHIWQSQPGRVMGRCFPLIGSVLRRRPPFQTQARLPLRHPRQIGSVGRSLPFASELSFADAMRPRSLAPESIWRSSGNRRVDPRTQTSYPDATRGRFPNPPGRRGCGVSHQSQVLRDQTSGCELTGSRLDKCFFWSNLLVYVGVIY